MHRRAALQAIGVGFGSLALGGCDGTDQESLTSKEKEEREKAHWQDKVKSTLSNGETVTSSYAEVFHKEYEILLSNQQRLNEMEVTAEEVVAVVDQVFAQFFETLRVAKRKRDQTIDRFGMRSEWNHVLAMEIPAILQRLVQQAVHRRRSMQKVLEEQSAPEESSREAA